MTAAQLFGLLATVGAAFLAQSVACACLFFKVRRLAGRPDLGQPDPTGAAARLTAQVRSLEARLARLETAASRRKTTGPGPESKRLRRLDARQVASADGPVLIAVPSLASTPDATGTEVLEEFDRRFGAIWALADSGLGADEVARQAGYPVGQVELILGLRRPKVGADPAHLPPARDQTDA